MRKRERDALRRSICQVALDKAYWSLLAQDPYSGNDAWEDNDREWHGPEVMEECRAVYARMVQAMLEMSPKLRIPKEVPDDKA